MVPRLALLAVLAIPIAAGAQPGETIFQGACADCHDPGSPRVLAGQKLLGDTSAITGDNPSDAIRLILHGRQPAPEQRGAWMPGFAPMLSDQQISAVLQWLRASAGRPPWPDLAERVREARR